MLCSPWFICPLHAAGFVMQIMFLQMYVDAIMSGGNRVSRCGLKVESELEFANGSGLAAAFDDSDTAVQGARED